MLIIINMEVTFLLTCFLFMAIVYFFVKFMQIYNTDQNYFRFLPWVETKVKPSEFPKYTDIMVKEETVSAMDLYRSLQNDNEARVIGSTFKPNTFTMTGKGYGDFVNFDPSDLDSYGGPRTYKFVGEGAYDSIELSDELKQKLKDYQNNPTEAKSTSIRNELQQLYSVENTKYKAPGPTYYEDTLPVS